MKELLKEAARLLFMTVRLTLIIVGLIYIVSRTIR